MNTLKTEREKKAFRLKRGWHYLKRCRLLQFLSFKDMQTVIALFIINLLVIIVSFITLYYKTYSQEKGKNPATKEDIEEITQKVETVKTDIALLGQKKISYHAERYAALIECHNKYYSWINTVLNISITGDFNEADEIRGRAKQKMEDAFLD